jgi:heptosyltransferase-1
MSTADTRPKTQRILVVRLGAMGDIIHTLPAVASLRAGFPDAHITWLVEPKWRYLLEAVPIDRIVELDRRSAASLWRALGAIRRPRADWAVDFQGLAKSAVPARIGARRVYGFHADFLRERFAAIAYSDKVAPTSHHVVDMNLDLAEACGGARRVEFPLPLGQPEGQLPESRFVLAHPLAGWGSKQWPLDRWAELAGLLAGVGVAMVVNGPPSAIDALNTCRPATSHVSGLPGLVDATRRATAVVGLDSGPLHLAAALGKPGVALFGPTDPARNGPYGGSLRVLRSEGAETTYRRRSDSADSMRSITAAQVFRAIMDRW